MRPSSLPRRRAAFTLIELLTVIAIIAILAAILFPVMGSALEGARRGSTMSNLRKISQGIAAYHLDNREYPEYLFGPAISQATGTPTGGAPYLSMRQVADIVQRGPRPSDTVEPLIRRIYAKSLFPAYVRDLDAFSSPNNVVTTQTGAGDVLLASRYINYDATDGSMERLSFAPDAAGNDLNTPVTLPFYRYDAFDASPKLLNTNGTIDNNTLIVRYARHWYPINSAAGVPVPGQAPDPAAVDEARKTKYERQLMWRDPPGETYVTMTTHHAPKGKAIILWLSGAAKVIDLRKFNNLVDPAGDVKAYELGPGD